VTETTRAVVEAFAVIAAFCGLVLLVVAVIVFALALVRVGVRGRVLVLPFRGGDSRAADLTSLFFDTIVEMEESWTQLAHEIRDLKAGFVERILRVASNGDAERPRHPLADGAAIEPPSEAFARTADVSMAPRTTGDELIEQVLLLEGDRSLSGADLGVISVAGVSFSPQNILALARRLPAICARRLLSGTVLILGDKSIVTVSYEERSLHRPSRRTSHIREVCGEAWLPAFEDLAFRLAKGRIDILRDLGSVSADEGAIEADSWGSCRAFLAGYVAQLQHYVSGRASDRERALTAYDVALSDQPIYPRAAYNSATLLYNRYAPKANEEAIRRFDLAAGSDDSRVRALALAGLGMAYSQAIHRFGSDPRDLLPKAREASEDALRIDDNLEEARFARAWASQGLGNWDDALREYEAVVHLDPKSAPGRRIASLALNNEGWIWLTKLSDERDALRTAERLLWRAVEYYPNKLAYNNLAEVARRVRRFDDALTLFGYAIRLDPTYVAAWNERACLKVELASLAGDQKSRERYLAQADADHRRATDLAEDNLYIDSLREDFAGARERHGVSAVSSHALA
jgi:tetratricopeptide (TPR) repeat protein